MYVDSAIISLKNGSKQRFLSIALIEHFTKPNTCIYIVACFCYHHYYYYLRVGKFHLLNEKKVWRATLQCEYLKKKHYMKRNNIYLQQVTILHQTMVDTLDHPHTKFHSIVEVNLWVILNKFIVMYTILCLVFSFLCSRNSKYFCILFNILE